MMYRNILKQIDACDVFGNIPVLNTGTIIVFVSFNFNCGSDHVGCQNLTNVKAPVYLYLADTYLCTRFNKKQRQINVFGII